MNRIYNNEMIFMACIVQLLKTEKLDIATLYLFCTLLIDDNLRLIIHDSVNLEKCTSRVCSHALLTRKITAFGPYFINALVILKQSDYIVITLNYIESTQKEFPKGNLKSKRLQRILREAEHLFEICHNFSAKDMYRKFNIQL